MNDTFNTCDRCGDFLERRKTCGACQRDPVDHSNTIADYGFMLFLILSNGIPLGIGFRSQLPTIPLPGPKSVIATLCYPPPCSVCSESSMVPWTYLLLRGGQCHSNAVLLSLVAVFGSLVALLMLVLAFSFICGRNNPVMSL